MFESHCYTFRASDKPQRMLARDNECKVITCHSRKLTMLLIFDIDGTICDTQSAEGECYAEALFVVTGIKADTLDWSQFQEPTSSAIIKEILANTSEKEHKEALFKNLFIELLKKIQHQYPQGFLPIKGAVDFIKHIRSNNLYDIAIASGGFDLEAEFKLKCCGLNIHDFPHATSSDTPKRKDIITLAAQKAGYPLTSVVYLGDGVWDVKATKELNIPMIGIGRKIETLKSLGILHTYVNFEDRQAILNTLRVFETSNPH